MLCSGEFNQDGYIHIILPFLSDPGIPGPIYGSGGSEGGLAKDHTSDFFPATFPAKGRVQKKNAAKVWSFTKPGGGSPRVIKKPNPFFWKSIFSVSL